MAKYVMALDQGTTSSRALIFDDRGAIAAVEQHEFPQHYRKPGWVEHDPEEIWESQRDVLEEGMEKRRRGMWILIREGSAARNLEELAPMVLDLVCYVMPTHAVPPLG